MGAPPPHRHATDKKPPSALLSRLYKLCTSENISESQVDDFLDQLRCTKLSAAVQVLASWAVAWMVLLYYGKLRYRWFDNGSHNCSSMKRCRLPLMIEAKGVEVSLSETHEQLLDHMERLAVERPAILSEDRALITTIRQHSLLRRLVSRFLQHEESAKELNPPLFARLDGIYPLLLPFPTLKEIAQSTFVYDISVIVPCYRESPQMVQKALSTLHRHCSAPSRVQLIIVTATDPDEPSDQTGLEKRYGDMYTGQHGWGDVRHIAYRGGGGRGPTLNMGALCSEGRVLFFLHADCQVPRRWDAMVHAALFPVQRSRTRPAAIPHACAFWLGIDTSQTRWLWKPWKSSTDDGCVPSRQYPWGIQAIRLMVNVRSILLKMPYGDQAIAMPATYFRYVGGFPNQPIMEDYDLMDHLRRRAAILPERLVMIPATCWCSPRRWQSAGVVYVTIANAVLVHRYATRREWTPARVFHYYYYGLRPSSNTDKNGNATNGGGKSD